MSTQIGRHKKGLVQKQVSKAAKSEHPDRQILEGIDSKTKWQQIATSGHPDRQILDGIGSKTSVKNSKK